jgi:hypothetical protein
MSRYYIPPSTASTNLAKSNSLANAVLAAAEMGQFSPAFINNIAKSLDEKLNTSSVTSPSGLSSSSSRLNPMSIMTNQAAVNRSNQAPMHSPNQQILNSYSSPFSPAVLAAAAAASAINPSNSNEYTQLIQFQLQQHQNQLQSQFNQQQNQSIQFQASDTLAANSSIKKEATSLPQILKTSTQSTPAPTPPSTTSSYVPQVEAISPTPEDQKENSNLQAVKEKIITEICKVEKDIASTQYQFDLLEKKQVVGLFLLGNYFLKPFLNKIQI